MEKINNTEELKIKFEEKQNEYDKLLTRIDRLKDIINELSTKYNADKEKKKKKLFDRVLSAIIITVFISAMSIYNIVCDFSFLESVAMSFMTILLSCDGIFVVSNNSANSKVSKDGILKIDRQTIENCEKHLNELLTEKNTLKVERDNAYARYSKNVDMLGNLSHFQEKLNNLTNLDNNIDGDIKQTGNRKIKVLERS